MASKKRKTPETPVVKLPRGRPTKRTDELVDELLWRVSSGYTIQSFVKDHPNITRQAITRWMKADPALREAVEHAKMIGCIWIEDEIQEIADNRTEFENDHQHRKLQMWAREKRLIWNQPLKYSQKLQVGGAHDLPALGGKTDEQRVLEIQHLLALAEERAKEDNGED